jgi:hypothetical protein
MKEAASFHTPIWFASIVSGERREHMNSHWNHHPQSGKWVHKDGQAQVEFQEASRKYLATIYEKGEVSAQITLDTLEEAKRLVEAKLALLG